jgi:hypothetical protein
MGGALNILNSLPLQSLAAQVEREASLDISRISVNLCSAFSEHLYS